MNPVTMFVLNSCPYCKQALSWMDEIRKESPKFSDVEVKIIDEGIEPDIADKYDYYYVPTYYINGVKVHEGAATKDIVRKVFEKASNMN